MILHGNAYSSKPFHCETRESERYEWWLTNTGGIRFGELILEELAACITKDGRKANKKL